MKTLGLAALLIATSLINSGCERSSAYGADEAPLDTFAILEDGVSLVLRTDPDSRYFCPGVVAEWHGNSADLTFVKAPMGSDVGVSSPAMPIVGKPDRAAAFLYTGHVPAGEPMSFYVVCGDERRRICGYRQPPSTPPQADRPPADR